MPSRSDKFPPADGPPPAPNAHSAKGQGRFGSLYAALALVGFSFGVWAGASKPKPSEVAEVKKDAPSPQPKSQPQPPVVNPEPKPREPEPEPKPKEPEPKAKEPEPKPKEPEPKPKEPEPKPKPPEPKTVPVKTVVFKEVEPVFRAYCNNCHGAGTGKPKGGVDLRSVASILKSEAVKPGMPDKSTVYLTMTSDGSEQMPPAGNKKPTAAEIKLVHDWIASGAKQRRTVRRRHGITKE
ncbi:MAG: c-type cytochrome [Gemmataceae bacterium]|nr:c-type cytochrome [Gemmataceae bacterium]